MSDRGELLGEITGQGTRLREEMGAVSGDLREEIRAGDEETRRHMRLLHEEVLARIAAIREGD